MARWSGVLLPPSPPAEKTTASKDQAGQASTGDGAGSGGGRGDNPRTMSKGNGTGEGEIALVIELNQGHEGSVITCIDVNVGGIGRADA